MAFLMVLFLIFINFQVVNAVAPEGIRADLYIHDYTE
jgi:hypothetical protein